MSTVQVGSLGSGGCFRFNGHKYIVHDKTLDNNVLCYSIDAWCSSPFGLEQYYAKSVIRERLEEIQEQFLGKIRIDDKLIDGRSPALNLEESPDGECFGRVGILSYFDYLKYRDLIEQHYHEEMWLSTPTFFTLRCLERPKVCYVKQNGLVGTEDLGDLKKVHPIFYLRSTTQVRRFEKKE